MKWMERNYTIAVTSYFNTLCSDIPTANLNMVQISAFFPSKILQIFSQFNLYFPPKKLFIGPPSPPKNKRIIYYLKE